MYKRTKWPKDRRPRDKIFLKKIFEVLCCILGMCTFFFFFVFLFFCMPNFYLGIQMQYIFGKFLIQNHLSHWNIIRISNYQIHLNWKFLKIAWNLDFKFLFNADIFWRTLSKLSQSLIYMQNLSSEIFSVLEENEWIAFKKWFPYFFFLRKSAGNLSQNVSVIPYSI